MIKWSGNVYAMRGVEPNESHLQQQFPHMEEVNVGYWTIYSLVKSPCLSGSLMPLLTG